MARELYGLSRAFENCKCRDDWRQPKGAGANKWKSKVRWDLASEIDWSPLSEEGGTIQDVEKDIQDRLQRKELWDMHGSRPGERTARF